MWCEGSPCGVCYFIFCLLTLVYPPCLPFFISTKQGCSPLEHLSHISLYNPLFKMKLNITFHINKMKMIIIFKKMNVKIKFKDWFSFNIIFNIILD
jgi:hypothetical protein